MSHDIEASIPHRAPFLLLDEILELGADSVRAAYTPRADDELGSRIYSGHYPGNPMTPGVLLVEIILQAAAVLAGEIVKNESLAGVPMVTRLRDVKFKNVVPPGAELEIKVRLTERLANAFFMKGSIAVGGKTAVQAEFAVALAEAGTSGS